MKKRIVSFLLALVMAVSLLPVSAFAANGAYNVAKDTTVQQADGSYQLLSAEHVFRDYQFSTDHQVALPEAR